MIDINIKIKKLLNDFNSKKINLSKLNYFIGQINKEYEKKNFDYLNALLYPEDIHNVRIPSSVSPPSTMFTLRSTITISTNEYGCFLYKFNPYFLAQESLAGGTQFREFYPGNPGYTRFWYPSPPFTSLFYIDSDNLDGFTPFERTSYDTWRSVYFDQVIPSNIYSQYRLVSGAINLRYIGSITRTKGVIGGAIDFHDFSILGARYTSHIVTGNVQESPYVYPDTGEGSTNYYSRPEEGLFDTYRDMFYSCENACLEGIRMLYFPPDNSYNEFVRIMDGRFLKMDWGYKKNDFKTNLYFYADEDYYKSRFWFYMYGQGLPSLRKDFKLDIVLNFECLPTNEFLNYCPIDVCRRSISFAEQKKIYDIVKDNAIQKIK